MKWLLVIILSFGTFSAKAQSWDEWFRQRKTQIKYLKQQIAALQVYIGFVKTGYDIARKGLTTIRDIKNGDFNLHHDFIGALSRVNPGIRSYAKVAGIITTQVRIIRNAQVAMANLKEGGQLSADELAYCKAVFDHLFEECLKTMDELLAVITSGELEMKDDERIKRIEALYADMEGKFLFSTHFSEGAISLSFQRLAEQGEIHRSKLLNGLR